MTLSRDEIEALLPFLVNGTLEGAELAEVEAAVAADEGLAADVATLRAIRATMQADETGFSPGEMGLARVMRDIEDAPVQLNRAPRTRMWQVAAALLLAVVIGQGALMMTQGGGGPGYELAGGAEADLVLTIVPSTTEEQLRNALLDAGVEITSGPSALGLYEVTVLEGITLEEAIGSLTSATGVIDSVAQP
ncbi:hypothetical protein [Cognatishimia sp.]|uniref:hypothetical protein n=1 Tax=Cognatishimia sp. TaxID=2211648 RepID=UPI003514C406